MARRTKRRVGNCQIEENIINGRRTFTCKRLRRAPTAQEIINSLDRKKRK